MVASVNHSRGAAEPPVRRRSVSAAAEVCKCHRMSFGWRKIEKPCGSQSYGQRIEMQNVVGRARYKNQNQQERK